MAFRITVVRIRDNKVFAQTDTITDPEELGGILGIMGKPSMFGTPDFKIVLNTVLEG